MSLVAMSFRSALLFAIIPFACASAQAASSLAFEDLEKSAQQAVDQATHGQTMEAWETLHDALIRHADEMPAGITGQGMRDAAELAKVLADGLSAAPDRDSGESSNISDAALDSAAFTILIGVYDAGARLSSPGAGPRATAVAYAREVARVMRNTGTELRTWRPQLRYRLLKLPGEWTRRAYTLAALSDHACALQIASAIADRPMDNSGPYSGIAELETGLARLENTAALVGPSCPAAAPHTIATPSKHAAPDPVPSSSAPEAKLADDGVSSDELDELENRISSIEDGLGAAMGAPGHPARHGRAPMEGESRERAPQHSAHRESSPRGENPPAGTLGLSHLPDVPRSLDD